MALLVKSAGGVKPSSSVDTSYVDSAIADAVANIGEGQLVNQLPTFRQAVAEFKAGIRSKLKIMVAGINMTGGVNKNRDDYNGFAKSWPVFLAKELEGINANIVANCNFYQGGNQYSTVARANNHDWRNVLEGQWIRGGAGRLLGSNLSSTTTTGSTQTFTPANGFISDRITVYYTWDGGFGSIAISIDGGSTTVQTINMGVGVTGGLIAVDVPVTRGANTYTITADCTGGKKVPEVGIHVWDSTIPSIEIIPISWTIGGINSLAGYTSILDQAPPLNPDLVIFSETAFSVESNSSASLFASDLALVKEKVEHYSDLVLASDPQIMTLSPDTTAQNAIVAKGLELKNVMQDFALTNNIPFVDVHGAWWGGNYSIPFNLSYYDDTTTTSAIGSQDVATVHAKFFKEFL